MCPVDDEMTKLKEKEWLCTKSPLLVRFGLLVFVYLYISNLSLYE